MDLDAALNTYIDESRELLEEMEEGLLSLGQVDDDECLNAIFRTVHTIKGSAGLFGLDDIVSFTHVLENLLDQLRAHELEISSDITSVIISCRDHISDLIDWVEGDREDLPAELFDKSNELIQQVQIFSISSVETSTQIEVPENQEPLKSNDLEGTQSGSENWHISLRFGKNSFRDGMDPLSFLRYLCGLGEIIYIRTLDDAIPPVDEIDVESCYLGFEISFKSDAEKQSIEDVFEFIRQDSQVQILSPRSKLADYIELIQSLPEEEMKLGDILVRSGSLTSNELKEALNLQNEGGDSNDTPRLGDVVVKSGMATQDLVDAAAKKQTQIRNNKKGEAQSVRVDAQKLDELINLIGELVIAGAGSALVAQASKNTYLSESLSSLTGLVEKVRDSALRLRMVQIGTTFNRFHRVVRDLSKDLGKEINLVIHGAETELDKTVIEKIVDPLTHLVRNALDHGIETSDTRIAKGKPPNGTLKLNAYHDSGSIVIEVSDDGAGLNNERILQKAIANGLVSKDTSLEPHEIFNLIFEPGFSTTEAVTNLSGRGVGMDVVKRNITALRGSVDVQSIPDQGTTFRVRMPLTLAIIDGFLTGVEGSSFVVPLDMVQECVELSDENRKTNEGGDYIDLRGEVLPFIRLRDVFSVAGAPPRHENIVVVQVNGNKAGLVVDNLMGEFQTVIKPLGQIFHKVPGISGSTILGNGEVALIIDVSSLIDQVTQFNNFNMSA